MRKQSEGLTKEYDRLLEEHAKLQVSMLVCSVASDQNLPPPPTPPAP